MKHLPCWNMDFRVTMNTQNGSRIILSLIRFKMRTIIFASTKSQIQTSICQTPTCFKNCTTITYRYRGNSETSWSPKRLHHPGKCSFGHNFQSIWVNDGVGWAHPGIIWGSLLPELKSCYFWSPGSLPQTEALRSELYICHMEEMSWWRWGLESPWDLSNGTPFPQVPRHFTAPTFLPTPSSTSPAWEDDWMELWIGLWLPLVVCSLCTKVVVQRQNYWTGLEFPGSTSTLSPNLSPHFLSLFGKWHQRVAPGVTCKGLGYDEGKPGVTRIAWTGVSSSEKIVGLGQEREKTLSKCR